MKQLWPAQATNAKTPTGDLRRRAEAKLQTQAPAAPLGAAETARLLHELQVHQIELEMQNEELIARRAEVEAGLALYTDLYDFAPVAYATLGNDSSIQRLNLACARLLGGDRAALQDRSLALLVDHRDRARFMHWLEQLSGGGDRRCQLRLRASAPMPGQAAQAMGERSVQMHAEPLPGGSGCRAVLHDLSEALQATAARQASEARLARALHGSSDGLWDWDIVSNQDYLSPRLMALLGYAEQETVEHDDAFFKRMHPDDRDHVRAAVQAHLDQRVPYDLEYRLRTVDGGYRWFHTRGQAKRDAQGQPVHMAGMVSDVHQRVLAEQAAKTWKARYEFTLKTSGQMLYDSTSSSNLVSFGGDFERLLGYSAEQLSGGQSQWLSLIHADDRDAFLREAQRAVNEAEDDKPFRLEYRLLTASGRYIVVLDEGHRLVDPVNGELHVVGLIRDVTERARALKQLLDSREALRALLNRLQRAQEDERLRVSREIHDELGQLLTGLKMDLRWIEKRLSGKDLPATFTGLLERALAASELNDQTMAVVQKLAAELRPAVLDQLGLAAALAQRVRQFGQRTGLPCSLHVDEAFVEPAPQAALELYYICQEALTNVTRHAQATGVEVRLDADDGDLRLQVSDDGVGMPAGTRARAGALGLLGMRERARACGATLRWGPVVPHGTCITVRLPLVDKAAVDIRP